MPLHTWDLNGGEWAIAIKPARYPAAVAFYEYDQPITPEPDGSYKLNPDEAVATTNLEANEGYVICPTEDNKPYLLISVADSTGFYTWRPQVIDGTLNTNANFVPMTADNAYGEPQGPPPILCRVGRIETQAELDALAKRYGVEVVGQFNPQASDKWFVLPQTTPLFIKLYKIKNVAGSTEVTNMFADYQINANQALVYCDQWESFNPDMGSMEPQYIISVSKEPTGREQSMWRLPENDNDPWCLGFGPLQ